MYVDVADYESTPWLPPLSHKAPPLFHIKNIMAVSHAFAAKWHAVDHAYRVNYPTSRIEVRARICDIGDNLTFVHKGLLDGSLSPSEALRCTAGIDLISNDFFTWFYDEDDDDEEDYDENDLQKWAAETFGYIEDGMESVGAMSGALNEGDVQTALVECMRYIELCMNMCKAAGRLT
jgi:hypothetical protein